MLNHRHASLETEPFDDATRIRHGAGFKEMLQDAARAAGVSPAVFIRAAVEKDARRVLAQQSTHVMTPEDAAAFEAALDAAPAPTPRAVAAREDYRTRVTHAD